MPFSRISVTIGNQEFSARPIEWDTDQDSHDGTGMKPDGTMMMPTRFETVCPDCSQLLQFCCDDIYVVEDPSDNHIYVDCICKKYGRKRMEDYSAMLYRLRSIDLNVHAFMAKAHGDIGCSKTVAVLALNRSKTFVDPIESGLLQIEGAVLVA